MAGTSLLMLIDDIASLLDDVAVMSKVAVKKTAGVLGDDLALNAQQLMGIAAERELPVVWAVAKGSFRNKLILVPAALLVSAVAPWAVLPLLMLGGAFLCFEGAEKIVHRVLHSRAEIEADQHRHWVAVANPEIDLVAFEAEKVRGAIRTDFILSAEIIVIALGTVAGEPFIKQLAVLSGIAVMMTIGVYGFVAAIVKLDDLGLYLHRMASPGAAGWVARRLGAGLLKAAPKLMVGLSVLGTAAMFLVGGSILLHGVHPVDALVEQWAASAAGVLPLLGMATRAVAEAGAGVVTGLLLVLGAALVARLKGRGPAPKA